jgi:hypothetical protein
MVVVNEIGIVFIVTWHASETRSFVRSRHRTKSTSRRERALRRKHR